MRRSHYLEPNHKTLIPYDLIWVDTEALNEEGKPEAGYQRLSFGYAIYERYSRKDPYKVIKSDTLRFTDADSFWDWVDSKSVSGRTIWIYAHNFNYDAGILDTSRILPELGYKCTLNINGSPLPLMVRWARDKRRLLMVDSMNIFPMPLDKLGDSVGLPKLTMPKDPEDIEAWNIYAWRDVEVIHKAILDFRRFVLDNDLGMYQKTLAGQAFSAYRHRFMHNPIYIHDHEIALSLEREGYHGGRTDAFYYGEVNAQLYKLDINSMYPFIMKSYQLPCKFNSYFTFYSAKWWERSRAEGSVIARVSVDTDEPVYAKVYDHKLIFPVGQFSTVLTTGEIDYAESKGHLVKVHEFASYDRADLFSDYVDYFYNMRLQYKADNNDAWAFVSKLLLNSLYGRFGMRGRRFEPSRDIFCAPGDETWHQSGPHEPFRLYRNRLGTTQVLMDDSESYNSMPAIAAEITGYARIYLWELIRLAGEDNVYYCDTDSIVTNRKGYNQVKHLIDDTRLGALKLEEKTRGASFYAPKDYIMNGKRVLKGVTKNARQINNRRYIQPVFRSWDSNLKRNEDGYILVKDTIKDFSHRNTKRVVLDTGFNLPIHLREI